MSQKRLEAVVSGRVQGVSFRYYTQRKAMEVGAVGWVRNQPDGTVSLVAEGAESSLNSLLEFIKVGPPYAQVAECDFRWEAPRGEFERFRITR
jgi:acylphosphatase